MQTDHWWLLQNLHRKCFRRDLKSLKSERSPESLPITGDEGSCWEAAVTVDDVDAEDDELSSNVAIELLAFDWSVGCSGTREGSADLAGLLPVTGLQAPELSSGQRKTSMGPCVLFRDISNP